ncbi:galactokinase [Flammeovirga pectinis]|uniref:Galactokinase n=1 Tax=Flammeovirga pectinis TaxID=2494373 RepID=A0A3Q9FUQ2_9BACT|nr:galactokinase [Flammeovirga pectinis]AZQ65539.1 galactokinase [Flammeovirga pectinis]
MQAKAIVEKFEALFSKDPLISRAPGRVNIIGEHTDYNDGFVLPASIDKEMVFALALNGTNTVNAYALDLEEEGSFDLSNIVPTEGWINYIKGVVAETAIKGLEPKGFDVVFAGDVPLGAGMSSSAALECALATGLNKLFEGNLSKIDIVLASQMSEHNFAGVKCGIMDQFASTFGQTNKVIKLDCRTKEYEYHNLDITGHKLVLCNTNVTHSLASSEYNTRREQCEAGVEIIKETYPNIINLRDVSVEQMHEFEGKMDETIYNRCSYVVEENDRLTKACAYMDKGDLVNLGKMIYGSHEGLSKKYAVSCPELDFLVEQTLEDDNVLGARMMGGGFGGCTINLVKEEAVDAFIERMTKAYKEGMNKDMSAYAVVIGEGARVEESVEA